MQDTQICFSGCFGPARASVGLSSFQAVDLSGVSIALTCVHQPSSSEAIVAESSSENAAAPPDYQYIGIGVLTAIASNAVGSTTRRAAA